jgi:hypothetical protein
MINWTEGKERWNNLKEQTKRLFNTAIRDKLHDRDTNKYFFVNV